MDTEPVTDISQLKTGDTVVITAKLAPSPYAQRVYVPELLGATRLRDAIGRGEVSRLVPPAPPEPDWQPGEIGQHVETGELFRYYPDHGMNDDRAPWLDLNDNEARYAYAADLAGKLKRMRLVPEDDDTPVEAHSHYCGRGDHDWKCHFTDLLHASHALRLTCPEHHS